MEYLEGYQSAIYCPPDKQEILRKKLSVTWEAVRETVIHGDMRPQNVLWRQLEVDRDIDIKVIDWDWACLVRSPKTYPPLMNHYDVCSFCHNMMILILF